MVGGAQRAPRGSPRVFPFCISIGEIDGERGLFPSETCEKIVVRGTISFCNNIITILPVGESFGWNVQLLCNE